jgi:NDP-sugar pyrophosphorylase family protein
MAGLSTRFLNEGIKTPKPLIKVNGKTLIEHSVSSLNIHGHYIFITRKYENPQDNIDLSEELKRLVPNCLEICLDKPTRGATETCLMAEQWINTDEELIITNCDQITNWKSGDFLKNIGQYSDFPDDYPFPDGGCVVTYTSDNPKNSFAIVENGQVTQIVEKKVVSNIALIGVHYWKKGKYFVESAKQLLESFEKTGVPECYISETYNFLIKKGLRITNYHVKENQYISLGTPYDLMIYESKIKEYFTDKPKTIFIDLDGTIIHHLHRFSDVVKEEPTLLEGVIEKINEWDSHGHRIIFVTARKESAREMTENQLRKLGLCWDQLIMGVSNGIRVMINDKLDEDNPDRTISINLKTNSGFKNIKWGDYGL